MMKFILQKENPLDDFKVELIKSKNYWDWRNEGKREELKTNIIIVQEGEDLLGFSPREFCPVGSIEFCLDWFKTFHNKFPKPLNIPIYFNKEKFVNRNIETVDLINNTIDQEKNKLEKFQKKYVYVKDSNTFKSSISGKYYYTPELLGKFINKQLQISEYIPIISEWRCFVYNGELLSINCYSGNQFKIPNEDLLMEIINSDLSSSPISYTLDVMVGEDNVTRILEVHDFFSCGLYGFSDYQRFPFMLYRWFTEYINKNESLY